VVTFTITGQVDLTDLERHGLQGERRPDGGSLLLQTLRTCESHHTTAMSAFGVMEPMVRDEDGPLLLPPTPTGNDNDVDYLPEGEEDEPPLPPLPKDNGDEEEGPPRTVRTGDGSYNILCAPQQQRPAYDNGVRHAGIVFVPRGE